MGEENGNPLQGSCLEQAPGTVEPDGLLYMGLQRIQLKRLSSSSSSSMTNDLDCPLVFKKLLYSE